MRLPPTLLSAEVKNEWRGGGFYLVFSHTPSSHEKRQRTFFFAAQIKLKFRILDQNRSICTEASSVISPNSEIKEIPLVRMHDLSSGVFVAYKVERRDSNVRIHSRSV